MRRARPYHGPQYASIYTLPTYGISSTAGWRRRDQKED